MSCVLGESRQFTAALGDWSSAEESPWKVCTDRHTEGGSAQTPAKPETSWAIREDRTAAAAFVLLERKVSGVVTSSGGP